MLARGVGNFRALDSFRRNLEKPGEDNGNGKAKNDEKNNRADRPVRNLGAQPATMYATATL
jgi:hypothetical protein